MTRLPAPGGPLTTHTISTWFRWLVRGIAVIVIVYFGLAFTTMLPVDTAGNAVARLIGHLEGPTTNPQAAFGELCEAEQTRIGREGFVDTSGAEYSVLAGRGARGVGSEHPASRAFDDEIKSSWWDLQVAGPTEVWRLHLVRVDTWWPFDTEWKVCGIERRS